MSTTSTNASSTAPRKLKILMLHGYTQSGALFHAKTRALEKALDKAFPPNPPSSTSTSKSATPGSLPSYPGGITLIYSSGPRKLRPADIPGFISTSTRTSEADDDDDDDAPDSRAWWQRNDNTGEYVGLEEGLQTIADTIRAAGGVDGVIGFSQGAAAAAMVASLLETGRVAAFTESHAKGEGVAYPSSFLSSPSEPIQPPLKFAVSYSGFKAPYALYDPFYNPKIATPTLHFLGSLDTLVEESRSLALLECCSRERVVFHVGGHFVPIGKEMVGLLVGFIRACCVEDEKLQENGKVEDIDGKL